MATRPALNKLFRIRAIRSRLKGINAQHRHS
jgi:hypothetical protein